ncbi:MAG: DUF4179 domain-containing protein [Oscillospiraceae bacterium]
MNRMEEYDALLRELEETPARLNCTVARAKARTQRQKLRRAVGIPASAVAAVCACFVLLVNVSGPFAQACSAIPVLKDLAQAVSFDRSLSAAVEHDWVQPIGLTERDGDLTMTVEYVIVDQKQLNIFYTLEGGPDTDPQAFYMPRSKLLNARGEQLACSVLSGSSHVDGELYTITADFASTEGTMPSEVRLECEMTRHNNDTNQNEPVGKFAFDLSFDPRFTEQARVVELGRWVELDGQRILFRDVEIYPTHIRVNVEDDPDNTAWLRGLSFYAEDENGVRYDKPGSGISSAGSVDSPFRQSFRLESSFFSEGEQLTLYLTGAQWLDKDREWTWVDLTTGETGFLPDGVTLHRFSRSGDAASLTFRVHTGPMNTYNPFRQWRNPDGKEQTFDGWSGGTAYNMEGEESPELPLEEYSDISFTLKGCTEDRVELELNYTRGLEYGAPIEVPVS